MKGVVSRLIALAQSTVVKVAGELWKNFYTKVCDSYFCIYKL